MGNHEKKWDMATVIRPHGEPVSRYLNPVGTVRNLWSHRQLLRQFIVREVASRYRGSVLGLFWSLITPLCMLAVYTYVFTFVFKAKWGDGLSGSKADFALATFCGLILYNLFAECISRAPSLILSNVNYVKKVVFPLEILPVSILGSALFNAIVSTVVLLAGVCVFKQSISPTILYFPLVLLPLVLLSVGISWILASLGVFLRDIGHLIVVVLQLLFFVTPIIYPLAFVPENLRFIVKLNPLAVIVEAGRQTLMMGQSPDWKWLLGVTILSAVVFQLGYAWFMKTKRGFADVI